MIGAIAGATMPTTFDISDSTIYLATHGSRAYGLDLPESDTDLIGICVPPTSVLLGFSTNFKQLTESAPDKVVYSIARFCELAVKGSPTYLEVLFCREFDLRVLTPAGALLRSNRDAFLSKNIYRTVVGFAHSQRKAVMAIRGWVVNPPKEPGRSGWSAGEQTEWDRYSAWRGTPKGKAALCCGYPPKPAVHMIRVLRMLVEILVWGKVQVYREDAAELMKIRTGEREFSDILDEADSLLRQASALLVDSPLPESPSVEVVNDLCVRAVEKHYSLEGVTWGLQV